MTVTTEIRSGVGRITLDRPEIANAFDEAMIADLTREIARLGDDPDVRVIVLAGAGRHFCGGADLSWMRRMADYSEPENQADADRLAALMRTLDCCPKPTVARVQGAAMAGALGLVACCDVAIAASDAEFAVSEVRLGLIPAVISPYLVRAMGPRQARRWFLTADRYRAADAMAAGLVHEVVAPDALDGAVDRTVVSLLKGAPQALAAAKALVATVDRPIDVSLVAETARLIAEIRAGDEAREGIGAFFEKRKPDWNR